MGSSPPVLTKPGPIWLCHSAGYEHNDAKLPLSAVAIYNTLPIAAKLGFKAVALLDYDGPTGLRRSEITKIYQRCALLRLNLIPGVVFGSGAFDAQDRSNPKAWAAHFDEIAWWAKYRSTKYFAFDTETEFGMYSQDVYSDDPAENGKPLQTEEQVYQSATALRWAMSTCVRLGVTPLLYGPQFNVGLNPRAALMVKLLGWQWPDGARLVHYHTDMRPPDRCNVLPLTGHPQMGGMSASQFMATGDRADEAYYAPPWDFDLQAA